MKYWLVLVSALAFSHGVLFAEAFSCPNGETDVMKYFAMAGPLRSIDFMSGTKNSIYTKVFPDEDFAGTGYWFWLKSPNGHGFDVKAFDKEHVYMRATELVWQDSATFKRFVHDLPIARRCVVEGQPGEEIRVRDTAYEYFAACRPYKQGQLGTAVNTLDAPVLMDTEGNIGKVWTRVLHYRYNCDRDYQQCRDEEQFYLANGYGEWQWKHYKNGTLVNSALISQIKSGTSSVDLPCQNSFEPRPSIRQCPVPPSRDSN